MEQEIEHKETSVPREDSKTDFLKEQDIQLQNLITTYGTKDWNLVSEALNSAFPHNIKTPRQCFARWQELLEIESSKKVWTEQDELAMIIAHKRHKNRWADISEALKGRSNNTIKNKFYSVFRKIRGKILKSDCSYVSKLELLEIHYIVSLIENYLAHPLLVPKPKGKRGKDFIYSLIHSLNDKMVADYKAKMQELTKHEGTMEELFTKLAGEVKEINEKNNVNNGQPVQNIMQVPRHVMQDSKIRPRTLNGNFITRRDSNGMNLFSDRSSQLNQSVSTQSSLQRKQLCDPVKIEDDKIFNNFSHPKDPLLDNSPLFGYGPMSPPFLFSPNTLSAGPGAIAAGAARAACFGHTANDFSEFSCIAKSYGERPRHENSTYQFHRPQTNQIKGPPRKQFIADSAHQSQYSNLPPRTYFSQPHNN